jgi:hypothetical protein
MRLFLAAVLLMVCTMQTQAFGGRLFGRVFKGRLVTAVVTPAPAKPVTSTPTPPAVMHQVVNRATVSTNCVNCTSK